MSPDPIEPGSSPGGEAQARACVACGNNVPPGAKLLSELRHSHEHPERPGGRSSRPPGTAPWEGCEIRWWRGYAKSGFYVLAITPSGQRYVVARSPMFWSFRSQTTSEKRAIGAHSALVEKLVDQGWRLVEDADPQAGGGPPRWALRFRRPLRADLEEAVRLGALADLGDG